MELEKYVSILQEGAAKSTAQLVNARKVLEVAAMMCDEMADELYDPEAGGTALHRAAVNLRTLARAIL